MPLQATTVSGIDDLIAKGLNIGVYLNNENKAAIPSNIGDWMIRYAAYPEGNKGDSLIVAVPTNCRTREIYNAGRKVWLKNLGFTDEKAWLYIKASQSLMYRWETPVAEFVRDNYDIDMNLWYQVMDANWGMGVATELGFKVAGELKRVRFISAMQILMAMRTYVTPGSI